MKPTLAAVFALFSPLVQDDHTITFKLKAPEAKQVNVHCETIGKQAMSRDPNGTWTYTTKALNPDLYSYTFEVDGLRITDPSNPEQKPNYFGNESQVLVPDGKALWEPRDVPHGVIHRHAYRSTIANHDRDLYVYTPPEYDASSTTTYPVLYLLHGFSDTSAGWTQIGKAHVILDNLIAEKKAVPMIVVMPLGYGDIEVLSGGWNGPKKKELWRKNVTDFDRTLVEEVIPLAEKHYPVRKDANNRALAGLSMGGSESIQGALNHPELFGWVGAFSSGGMPADLSEAYPKASGEPKPNFKLFWIACGRQDGLMDSNRKLVEWLKSCNIAHEWQETDGGHAWGVWRRYLAEFTPKLFKP